MRRMSFSLTKEAVISQRKVVTRRQGWASLKPGDIIQPIEKGMGLKKGEKQKLLGCPIRILSIEMVEIQDIDLDDVVMEGFPDSTIEEFIALYCKANGVKPNDYCRRIHFEYVIKLDDSERVHTELKYVGSQKGKKKVYDRYLSFIDRYLFVYLSDWWPRFRRQNFGCQNELEVHLFGYRFVLTTLPF